MTAVRRQPLTSRPRTLRIVPLICALLAPSTVSAQMTVEKRHTLRLMATPTGALPPTAMPMPASRNHNYWGARVQAGHRRGGGEIPQFAVGGGIDFQWRGGSVFGVTGGYRTVDCNSADAECPGDGPILGARARFNVISGGPTIGALFGDNSATTTLGAEVGWGYARDALPGEDTCTVDIGVPISHAMLQTVRVVAFVSPGVVWEVGCGPQAASGASYLTSIGVGVQQLGGRALDMHVGTQKIFRSDTGYLLGVSVTYVRMP
jgi:hypothetical protein